MPEPQPAPLLIGISESTDRTFYAAPRDVKESSGTRNLLMVFNRAVQYIKRLNDEKYLGRDDWRLPTEQELDLMIETKYENGLSKTFNDLSEFDPDRPYEMWYMALRVLPSGDEEVYARMARLGSLSYTTGKDSPIEFSLRPVCG